MLLSATAMKGEPRILRLQSPLYIFGDIHGNLEDLRFFAEHCWNNEMAGSSSDFLFLGDYVDRGAQASG